VKSDYVSVRWTGFIKVDSADSYVFSVHANDGVRLYVDQKLIIDELSSVTDEVSGHRLISEPVVLEGNKLLPIEIEYFEEREVAFITLLMRKESSSVDVVVPAESLYSFVSQVPISGTSNTVNAFYTPRRPTDVQ
jgi:hypothetical protein